MRSYLIRPQEAQHLILSLRSFTDVALGQRELVLEIPRVRSELLAAKALPRLRAGEPFPAGARSPAGADPVGAPGTWPADRDSVLRDLAEAGRTFHAAIMDATATDPERRVQHPYFGLIPLEAFALIATAHTRHHMGFLPAGPPPA